MKTFLFQRGDIPSCEYRRVSREEYEEFCDKYRLKYAYGDNSVNLYHIVYWLYNQFVPGKPFFEDFQKYNGFEIFEKCKRNFSPNCACYAIMLNDLLLALGFKSKAVWCLPADTKDTECHALNHVFDEDKNEWYVVDPSCGSIICNESGKKVDLMTLRLTIGQGDYVYPHRNKHIRRPDEYIKDYNDYMKKKLYQFLTHNAQGISYPLEETAILIHPIGSKKMHKSIWQSTENIAYLYN